MADVRFYHLTTRTFDQALPALLTKALAGNRRILIRLGSEADVQHLDEHLWTYSPDSFLPHGADDAPDASKQPVLITCQDAVNGNAADMLVLQRNLDETPDLSGYALCCDFVDGQSDVSVSSARSRWKAYKAEGHAVTYWQQTETGGWEQKA